MPDTAVKRCVNLITNPALLYDRLLWRCYFFNVNRLIKIHFRKNPNKRDAVILASSGHAGNTLLRFVWLNTISLTELGGREVDFKMLYDHMPFDGYFGDLKKDWAFKSLPCVLKTHCMYSRKYEAFRKVHFFRNPLDTMVSLFMYLSKRVSGPEVADFSWIETKIFNRPNIQFKGSFHDFLTRNIDKYCEHFKSWMSAGPVPASYDTLISERSFFYFDQIFRRLGLRIEKSILEEAVNRSNREKLKDKPQSEKMAKLSGINFIRDGSAGQWSRFYGKEELDYVAHRLAYHGLDKPEAFPESYRPLLINWPIGGSLLKIREDLAQKTRGSCPDIQRKVMTE